MAENHPSRKPCTKQDQDELERRTLKEYWSDEEKGLDWYIENLLPQELACAAVTQGDDGLPRLQRPAKPIDVLAMMVGESLEPLFQLICVLQPRKIVLVLNKAYRDESGKKRLETMQDWIEELAEHPDLGEYRPSLAREDVWGAILEYDTPTAVFRVLDRTLREVMRGSNFGGKEAGEPLIMVDITGAKKSMMVGAFLYAAHSGLPMTYVDFDSDKYNKTWGRPYGYACKIREIANPYQAFALRDWERVRELYHRYRFRAAKVLIEQIKDVMGENLEGGEETLYVREDIEKVERLMDWMDVLNLWENGDYYAAREKANKREIPLSLLPKAVEILGEIWPYGDPKQDAREAAAALLDAHLRLKQGKDSPSDSIFAHPEWLLAYVLDEQAKIKRLIDNEDWRSGYLRAAGLHEFLLKARLAMCWVNGALEACPTGCRGQWGEVSTFPDEYEAFKFMVNESNERRFRETLSSSRERFNLKGGNVRLTAKAPTLMTYNPQSALDLNSALFGQESNARPLFVKLRGEAIHTHLTIPHHVAKEALTLIDGAINEFLDNWFTEFYSEVKITDFRKTQAPRWKELCDDILHLDFLPPRLRDDMSQEVIL